jgi:hypothetical protein
MDVAEEASAPEPIPAEEASPPFQPTLFRRVVVAPFWAGLLGCGASLWLGGVIGGLGSARIIARPSPELIVLLPLLAGLALALWLGFRGPPQSYARLVGRIVGALFFGAFCAGITVLILAVIFDALHLRNGPAFVTVALVGALLAGLALARLHGIGAARPRRIKIAVAAAAVLFVSCWPVTPSLRCWIGFGEGCRVAAQENRDDPRAAAAIGARGCAREDAVSCRLAGQAYQSEGPTRNLARAEDFFREGCALGDSEACDRVHTSELERRCDRYGAFACAELAQVYDHGEGAPQNTALARRYYRKACLLGADAACQESGGR